MSFPPVEISDLWRTRWRPSSKTMRQYGAIIDTAAADPAWLPALSQAQRTQAAENLAEFSEWLADQQAGRHWKRKRLRSLAIGLGLTTAGLIVLVSAPVTLPGVLLAGAGAANLVYDVSDTAFQASIQPRVRYLRALIEDLDRLLRR